MPYVLYGGLQCIGLLCFGGGPCPSLYTLEIGLQVSWSGTSLGILLLALLSNFFIPTSPTRIRVYYNRYNIWDMSYPLSENYICNVSSPVVLDLTCPSCSNSKLTQHGCLYLPVFVWATKYTTNTLVSSETTWIIYLKIYSMCLL
jgi:hypothetical protein